MSVAAVHAFWARTMSHAPDKDWQTIIRHSIIQVCATLRPATNTKTGTMSEPSCAVLYALGSLVMPKVAVEIGTFVGTSARVLGVWADQVYTCDKDNDLFYWHGITTYPLKTSTDMLADLVGKRVKADLFFFDGRIQMEDLPLIDLLSHDNTLYAFDDYIGGEKGVVNMARLSPCKPRHTIVPAYPGTTIAALVPECFL